MLIKVNFYEVHYIQKSLFFDITYYLFRKEQSFRHKTLLISKTVALFDINIIFLKIVI